jgi:dUTP pyrophosphatase
MSFQPIKYELRIKVQNSDNIDIKHFYESFQSHHNGDSGIDLYHFNEVKVDFLKVGTIDLLVQCEMIDLTTGQFVSYYLVPRSSISKTPFQLANSIGIIDAGYRGNIMAKVRCFDTNGATMGCGSFFQIIAPDMQPIQVKVVESLSETSRGDGGFGSTTK